MLTAAGAGFNGVAQSKLQLRAVAHSPMYTETGTGIGVTLRRGREEAMRHQIWHRDTGDFLDQAFSPRKSIAISLACAFAIELNSPRDVWVVGSNCTQGGTLDEGQLGVHWGSRLRNSELVGLRARPSLIVAVPGEPSRQGDVIFTE